MPGGGLPGPLATCISGAGANLAQVGCESTKRRKHGVRGTVLEMGSLRLSRSFVFVPSSAPGPGLAGADFKVPYRGTPLLCQLARFGGAGHSARNAELQLDEREGLSPQTTNGF